MDKYIVKPTYMIDKNGYKHSVEDLICDGNHNENETNPSTCNCANIINRIDNTINNIETRVTSLEQNNNDGNNNGNVCNCTEDIININMTINETIDYVEDHESRITELENSKCTCSTQKYEVRKYTLEKSDDKSYRMVFKEDVQYPIRNVFLSLKVTNDYIKQVTLNHADYIDDHETRITALEQNNNNGSSGSNPTTCNCTEVIERIGQEIGNLDNSVITINNNIDTINQTIVNIDRDVGNLGNNIATINQTFIDIDGTLIDIENDIIDINTRLDNINTGNGGSSSCTVNCAEKLNYETIDLSVFNSGKDFNNNMAYTESSMNQYVNVKEAIQAVNQNVSANKNIIESYSGSITNINSLLNQTRSQVTTNITNIQLLENRMTDVETLAQGNKNKIDSLPDYSQSINNLANVLEEHNSNNDAMFADIDDRFNNYVTGEIFDERVEGIDREITNVDNKFDNYVLTSVYEEERQTDIENLYEEIITRCEAINTSILGHKEWLEDIENNQIPNAINELRQNVIKDLNYIWNQLRKQFSNNTNFPELGTAGFSKWNCDV